MAIGIDNFQSPNLPSKSCHEGTQKLQPNKDEKEGCNAKDEE